MAIRQLAGVDRGDRLDGKHPHSRHSEWFGLGHERRRAEHESGAADRCARSDRPAGCDTATIDQDQCTVVAQRGRLTE